jgi:hypothetical protein
MKLLREESGDTGIEYGLVAKPPSGRPAKAGLFEIKDALGKIRREGAAVADSLSSVFRPQ